MLSVTDRIKTVQQPQGGYVPKSFFLEKEYEDYYSVSEVRSDLASIQGTVVDYLTRFMLTNDKYDAFDISLQGARKIDDAYENEDETRNIMALLEKVTGLDDDSIKAACKIVYYDSAFRIGVKAYKKPNDSDFTSNLFLNIKILVKRSLMFFNSIGGITSTKMTFEGGYTDLVTSGDGDYLSKDTLIDLKVSKEDFSSRWSLQLLMYYLLGFHSIHPEYKKIKKICIFNPYKNKSYLCKIKDISDESMYKVSCEVLGYKMVHRCYNIADNTYDYSKWKEVDGSDKYIVKSFLTNTFVKTDFDICSFGDGIHDITVNDYWTFLKTFDEYKFSLKPLFRYTESIKLIKRSGYYMFVSVSVRGKYSLLQGAQLHTLRYSPEYYYDYIEQYANAVIRYFSKYWSALQEVSEQIKTLKPTEKCLREGYADYLQEEEKLFGKTKLESLSFDDWYEKYGCNYKFTGKIHGCIVDLDWSNHIYVNPVDGTVTPYNALSMYDKDVYKNTRSLLAAQRPEMLPAFDKMIKTEQYKKSTSLITQNSNKANISLTDQSNEISTEIVKVYDYDMYAVSNRIKPLYKIYECKWIQVWYDEILEKKTKSLK